MASTTLGSLRRLRRPRNIACVPLRASKARPERHTESILEGLHLSKPPNRKTIMTNLPLTTNTATARPVVPMAAQPLLLIMLQAAAFMVAAEARVIAALLPALAADLHSTIASAGLLITVYALPYGLFQLVYGPLADRFSRQRVLAVALGLFALGTLCSGLAPNMAVLLGLRVCTGAAAAGVIPVALAYIGDTVPYAERQAVLGRMVGVAAFAGVISAALGGAIAELVIWRVLFLGYGALALLVAALLLRLPMGSPRPHGPPAAGLLAPYRAVVARAGRHGGALYGLVLIEGFAATGTFGYLG